MQINPPDNSMRQDMAKLLQEMQYRKVSHSDAVMNDSASRLDLLIQKAIPQYSHIDSNAVHDARQALNNGSLDTPEVIRMTAQKLLTYGI